MPKLTYKKIVENHVFMDSERWLMELMRKNNIDFRYTEDKGVTFERNGTSYLYESKIEIVKRDYDYCTVIVGGSIDEYNIYHSVIWNSSKTEILWMAVPDTRQNLGIKEFRIA